MDQLTRTSAELGSYQNRKITRRRGSAGLVSDLSLVPKSRLRDVVCSWVAGEREGQWYEPPAEGRAGGGRGLFRKRPQVARRDACEVEIAAMGSGAISSRDHGLLLWVIFSNALQTAFGRP